MNNRLAIIVYSCWKNSDMWGIFGKLFRKYWKNCEYKLILVTDRNMSKSDASLFDKVICIDGSWYEMISYAICEVNTEFVMLMMDDYLLCDTVDCRIIERAIQDASRYNAANIRFEKSDIRLDKKKYELDDFYEVYTPGKAYSLTTQIGIWKSEILLSYMRPEWSAWDFERKGSLYICDDEHPLLGTKDYEFPYIEGIRKGKWMKQGVELCVNEGINFDNNMRKRYNALGQMLLYVKTAIYNINPTFVLRLYNFLTDRIVFSTTK